MGSAVTAGIGQMAQAGGLLQGLSGSGAWASAGRAALSSGVTQAMRGDWSWRQIVASAVGAGAGAAAGNALGNSMGSVGQGIARGFVGGVAGQWASPGGKANYGSVFASTLGSVLGDEIAGGMQTQGQGPWSDNNYENGADIEDSIARTNREAAWGGSGLRLGGGGAGLRVTAGAAAAWADDVDRGIQDNARALTNFDAAAGRVWSQEDAQAALDARAGLVRQNTRAEAYGRELAQARQQSVAQAADPLSTVLGYSQSYPALAREVDGYDQLVAAGLMSPQQARDSLLASPRAYATLRSDYETPVAVPAGGPSLTPWDGVTRLSPTEAYLAKARGGLDAVRGDSLHFQVAQGLPDAASLMVGDLAAARVAGLLGRAAAPVQGLMFGERAMLMSSLRAEMAAGLAGDLAVMPGLAAETLSLRPDRLLSTGAAAIHPGRLAAESTDVTRESILRALRQAETPESLAAAKLLSRERLKLNILETDPSGRNLGGLYRFGSRSIDIYSDAFVTPVQGAGYTTHEATHFMQGLSRSNYNLGHEFDAFRAQGAVDRGHWSNGLSDGQLQSLLGTHPVYRGVRPSPNWPR